MRDARTFNPLVELTKARLREMLREPEIIFWVFAFPILMALALGIAFRSRGQEDVRVGIEFREGAVAMYEALERERGMWVRILEPSEIEAAMRSGRVHVIVVPGAPPTYRFDAARPESRLARVAVDLALQRAAGRRDLWHAREEQVTTPGSRYIDWLIPGLLGMNIMGTGMWGIGFSVVQARTRKLLKRFMATPMRRGHYLASYLLGRLVFLALEVGVLVGFAMVVLDVPVRGSFVALGLTSLAGALAFGGLGLLLASRPQTVEAVSGLMNLVMLPMWILSGVFFSSSNFPEAMQPFIRALPLTALNDALRAVMIDGSPLTSLGPQAAVLGLWGSLSFGAALRVFRWR